MKGLLEPPKVLTQIRTLLTSCQAEPLGNTLSKAVQDQLQLLERDLDDFIQDCHAGDALLKAVFAACDQSILVLDASGKVSECNPTAEQMFNLQRSELLGRNIRDFLCSGAEVHPDSSSLADHLANSAGLRHDWMLVPAEGWRIPVSLVMRCVEQQSPYSQSLYVCLLQDLSRIRQLEHDLPGAIEAERQRIGRELHDSVAQSLTGITLQARSAAVSLMRQAQETWVLFEWFDERVQAVLQSLDELIQGLAPADLEQGGLLLALQRLILEPLQSAQVRITLDYALRIPPRTSWVSLQLLRIAQEAVHNAVKHAKASRIDIHLSREHGLLSLSVTDNGQGLSSTEITHTKGRGILNMQHRARAMGARLEFKSASPRGLVVLCTLQDDST